MWEFILFLVISFYISSVFGVDKFRQSCAQNSENEKKKHDSVFLLYLTNVIKADRYFKEHSREIIDEVSDDLKYIYSDLSDVKFITYLSDYKEVWNPSMVALHIWLAKNGHIMTREYCYGKMTWNYALPEYNRKAPVRIRKRWRYSWC